MTNNKLKELYWNSHVPFQKIKKMSGFHDIDIWDIVGKFEVDCHLCGESVIFRNRSARGSFNENNEYCCMKCRQLVEQYLMMKGNYNFSFRGEVSEIDNDFILLVRSVGYDSVSKSIENYYTLIESQKKEKKEYIDNFLLGKN